MQYKTVLPGHITRVASNVDKAKRHRFKSERVQLDSKSKELLTKYRKGLIWKSGVKS